MGVVEVEEAVANARGEVAVAAVVNVLDVVVPEAVL